MEKTLVIRLAALLLGALAPAGLAASATGSNIVVWVEDSLPAGAQSGADGGDSWDWISSNPAPYSGTLCQESTVASGLHEHYFSGATQALTVNAGDTLFAAVYIDPNNVPGEIMLQWNDGSSWNHRAYWGGYYISYGANNTASSYYMGPIPAAGQWTLLTIPSGVVGLGPSTVSGMAFSLYNGGASWDYAGDATSIETNATSSAGSQNSGGSGTNTSTTTNSTTTNTGATTSTPYSNAAPSSITNMFAQANSTNALPGLTSVDDMMLQLPFIGNNALHILTPTMLEVDLVTSKAADPAPVTNWNLVNSLDAFTSPGLSSLAVTANGQPVSISAIGFKRRPLYAPMSNYDLRVEDSIYLQLSTPIASNQTVQVSNADGTLWSSNVQFVSAAIPLRYNPAIHVNQEGYLPSYPKQAMIGYYLGSLGELPVNANAGFQIVDAVTGNEVYQGSLTLRQDQGYSYLPSPYQQVYQADFSSFSTPGQYRLVIPGMGASMPFRIDEGVAMCFARAYALGLYHQRCGASLGLPYTRFAHAACHTNPASVPMPASSFDFTWTTISNYAVTINSDNPPQIAPFLTSSQESLFPFVNQGTVNTSGGHHDAGDYSKYTINSASLVHYLMFEVDSLPGVAALDNLGIAESGDGISDVMQEAKWESDYLAKIQDADGGFYFLVYPTDREYESNVTPEDGDPQVVWPKTTSVTAAATAALAQCASSPLFKKTYPQTAAQYLQKAQLGWSFLTNALTKHGQHGAYQKITSYGDDFADNDEVAWAACQIYLATGDAYAHQLLTNWFNPSDPATWRWGWWHMSESYGNCIRSYAFAVQSGRVASTSQLNATFLSACTNEIAAAGNDVLAWTEQCAYGTAFQTQTKAVQSAGWYFSADQAFDMVVAYQLNPNTNYITALLNNMNYEGGCNPVNASYITGLGWKRQHGIVSQWELNDIRAFAPSGIPIGNIQSDFDYLWDYAGELEELSFPSDGAATAPYPFYDRWGDSWNVTTEMVILNQARGLGSLAFLAAQTSLASQPWQAVSATLNVPSGVMPLGSNVTVTMQAPGLDLSTARINWEAGGQLPVFGQSFTFAPSHNGTIWVEGEAQFPDGRRVFASNSITVNSPNVIWVEDSIPVGGQPGSDGGDAWNWQSGNPSPYSGQLDQQSVTASGEHQVYFSGASQTMSIGTNSTLYAWIYLNPNNPPTEAMLQWCDSSGSWEHRAYWGVNSVTFGVDGTVSRTNVGSLPTPGHWAQLAVPASLVGLQGSVVTGLAFTLFNGGATWDCAGVSNSMTLSNNPTTTVSASTTSVSRVLLQPGSFLLTRTGDTSSALNVSYALGGSATAGVDFQVSQTNQVTFAAGASTATLTVTPQTTTNLVGSQNIVLTLGSGSGYSVGNPNAASMSLTGSAVPISSIKMTGGSPNFTWPSVAGAAYRVLYKNNLTDPAWLNAADIPSAGAVTTWSDTNNATLTHRFYLFLRTQ